MKAQELRIGNWVKWVFPNRNNQPNKIKYCQVQSIGGLVGVLDSAYGYDQVEPIPLTEQWLIDFGFVGNGQGLFDKYTGHLNFWQFTIYASKTGMVIRRPVSLKVYHVHQLQNLYFALTGEDLHL